MRASELFLGIAGSLGGWLVITGHALILAVIPKVDCSVDSLDPWRGTLVMGVLGILSALLVGTGMPWRAGIRYASVVAIPLLLYGFFVVLPYLEVTNAGVHPCAVHSSAPSEVRADVWQRIWAPTQLLFLMGATWQAYRYWRPARP